MKLDVIGADFENIATSIPREIENFVASNVVISGATGFVGKWVIGAWYHASLETERTGKLLISSRNPDAIFDTYPFLKGHPRVQLCRSDIRSFEIPRDFQEPIVIHGATSASEQLNLLDPREMVDVIVNGARQLTESCKKAGAKKLVNLSSGAVYGYGELGRPPFGEECLGGPDISNPRNAYHESKRLSELLISVFANESQSEAVSLRLFTFVGPFLPLDRHFAVAMFIREALETGRIIVKSGGNSIRSYQYGRDLAKYIVGASVRKMNFPAYNVGSEAAISIGDLALSVAKCVGPGTEVITAGSDTAGTASSYVPNTSLIRAELAIGDELELGSSLERTIEHIQINELALRK
jgi:nucleoside-diphosphate-sugar epimerase